MIWLQASMSSWMKSLCFHLASGTPKFASSHLKNYPLLTRGKGRQSGRRTVIRPGLSLIGGLEPSDVLGSFHTAWSVIERFLTQLSFWAHETRFEWTAFSGLPISKKSQSLLACYFYIVISSCSISTWFAIRHIKGKPNATLCSLLHNASECGWGLWSLSFAWKWRTNCH